MPLYLGHWDDGELGNLRTMVNHEELPGERSAHLYWRIGPRKRYRKTTAVGFAPATGKLWGRFERCKDWLGAPKLGFRGAERSILVLQAIDIFALHVSDKEIVASVKIDIVSAVEKPFVADIMVGRGRDGVSLFRAGRSTNKKVTISRGEHKMGNDWGVSISAVP